jgi:hypothetical protein
MLCPKKMPRTKVLFLCFIISLAVRGQDTLQQFILFPGALEKTCRVSLGVTFTTTPEAITEEMHISVPAFDVHVLKGAGPNFNFEAQAQIQGLQNHASVGFRWLHVLSDKVNLSAGDDMAGWVGWIELETADAKGYGLLNYPNISIGYRFDKELLLTFKAELLLNFYQQFFVGKQQIEKNPVAYSGQAFTLALEQPFFKDTWVTLAFRAMYSNFFWQTWLLFENYDRNIFYPELTAKFVL